MQAARGVSHLRKVSARSPHFSSAVSGKPLNPLRESLRTRHGGRRAGQTCGRWVKRFIFFHNLRHPAETAESTINAFPTHLAVKERVDESTPQRAFGQAVKQASRVKRASRRALRHSLAAHLLAGGRHIRAVQEFPGHRDVKTTMIDTHVLNRGPAGVGSPADGL